MHLRKITVVSVITLQAAHFSQCIVKFNTLPNLLTLVFSEYIKRNN